MNIGEWIQNHWPETLTALGAGGGGAFGMKRFIDREQDKRLNRLDKKVTRLDERVTQLEEDMPIVKEKLLTNTAFDKQLRSDFKDHRENLDKRLDRLETKFDKIIDKLFDIQSKK